MTSVKFNTFILKNVEDAKKVTCSVFDATIRGFAILNPWRESWCKSCPEIWTIANQFPSCCYLNSINRIIVVQVYSMTCFYKCSAIWNIYRFSSLNPVNTFFSASKRTFLSPSMNQISIFLIFWWSLVLLFQQLLSAPIY